MAPAATRASARHPGHADTFRQLAEVKRADAGAEEGEEIGERGNLASPVHVEGDRLQQNAQDEQGALGEENQQHRGDDHGPGI